jgi:hypothetical protein
VNNSDRENNSVVPGDNPLQICQKASMGNWLMSRNVQYPLLFTLYVSNRSLNECRILK